MSNWLGHSTFGVDLGAERVVPGVRVMLRPPASSRSGCDRATRPAAVLQPGVPGQGMPKAPRLHSLPSSAVRVRLELRRAGSACGAEGGINAGRCGSGFPTGISGCVFVGGKEREWSLFQLRAPVERGLCISVQKLAQGRRRNQQCDF